MSLASLDFKLTMILLITIILVLPAINWLATLAMVLVGLMFGIPVEEISFGFGKKFFTFHIAGTEVNFRWIPSGSFCRFENTEFHDVDVESDTTSPVARTKDEAPNAFNFKPAPVRFLTVLAGPLLIFLIAFGIYQDQAWNEIVSGFRQFLRATLSPIDVLPDYLRKYVAVVNEEGWLRGIGLAATKLAAVQLIPIPTMGIAQALVQLLPTKAQKTRMWMILSTIGSLAIFVVGMIWAVSILIRIIVEW